MRVSGLRQLLEAMAGLRVGELITYERINEIIDRESRSTSGRSVVLRAIKILRRPPYGVSILNERDKGYYRGTLDERHEWVSGRRDHCRRVMTEGYISAAVVDKEELDTATDNQKQKLLQEQSKIGFELMFSARLEKAKRLPSPDKILPMTSMLGEMIEKRKRNQVSR